MMIRKPAILVLFLLLAALSAPAVFAAEDVSEGYDENTELTVKGTVKEILRDRRGPVIVLFDAGPRQYAVITAPAWYLVQEAIVFHPGAAYEIRGSRYIGRDGKPYLIADSIKELSSGKTVTLRDAQHHPHWMGGHRMRRGHQ